MCCPVFVQEQPVGVLFVDRRDRGEAFSKAQLRLAATTANFLALFLEKEKYEAASRERERLAVIGEVVAGLAHYAKNLLMGLSFGTSCLERQFAENAPRGSREALDAVALSSQQISNLVMDMLSYAKEREPVRSEVDLAQVIDHVATVYRLLLDDNDVDFSVDVASDVPTVSADPQALERVFFNLIANAIDALTEVPGEGVRQIKVSIEKEGEGAVEVRVKDTGCGIPKDKVEDVFRVFFSTKGSRGTGLGLAVVRKIVDEHSGSIEVTSEEGQGTEFRLVFPAKAPETTSE
jgi:signal transduction histidine kinase